MALTKYDGKLEELLDQVGFRASTPVVVLKKPRGRKSYRVYWSDDQDMDDLWFIDVDEITSAKKPENYMITSAQFP